MTSLHIDWTSFSECETCHDVGVTLFVVWNNVKEAVDRLNRLDLNMKIHSEVRRGQFGPGLVMQGGGRGYDGSKIEYVAPYIGSNYDGDGKVIRFRVFSEDNAALAAWLASPSHPALE